MLFSIYIDNLLSKLKHLGLGCHVGLTYAGAFGYADDIALLSPSIYGLKKMISICESYAQDYHITFNPAKSKLLCFNVSSLGISPIYLNGTPVTVVNKDKHLGNYISTNIYDRNIISNVCDFYQRSNMSSVTLAFVIVKHCTKYILLFVCTCTVVNFGI